MSVSDAVSLVRAFRRVRLLVIGDAILDSYVEGTAERLCTEAPVAVVRKTGQERSAGGAANVACNAASLGANVLFVGLIGDDEAGVTLRGTLRTLGIEDRWLVSDSSCATMHKSRILAGGQYIVRLDEGQVQFVSSAARERLLDNLTDTFARCDAVVLSDYSAGTVDDALIERVIELRRERPVPLIVDSKQLLKYRRAKATVVTPNETEAAALLSRGAKRPLPPAERALRLTDVEATAKQLLELLDAEHVALTLGEHGVVIATRNAFTRHLAAHSVKDADDVGAGDTFAAALSLAVAARASFEDAATVAIEAASIVVARRHTALASREELLDRLRRARGAARRRHVITTELGDPRGLEALRDRLDGDRAEGRTIVFTNGVFDIVHAGHVQFLRRAKELGDVLVVGVNSDRSVRRLKGKARPINCEADRLALMAALEPVDHVVLFDEDTPADLIRALRPHVHVKGGDYANQRLPEADAVEEVGARPVILPRIGAQSTSAVIDRIVSLSPDSRSRETA